MEKKKINKENEMDCFENNNLEESFAIREARKVINEYIRRIEIDKKRKEKSIKEKSVKENKMEIKNIVLKRILLIIILFLIAENILLIIQ